MRAATWAYETAAVFWWAKKQMFCQRITDFVASNINPQTTIFSLHRTSDMNPLNVDHLHLSIIPENKLFTLTLFLQAVVEVRVSQLCLDLMLLLDSPVQHTFISKVEEYDHQMHAFKFISDMVHLHCESVPIVNLALWSVPIWQLYQLRMFLGG